MRIAGPDDTQAHTSLRRREARFSTTPHAGSSVSLSTPRQGYLSLAVLRILTTTILFRLRHSLPHTALAGAPDQETIELSNRELLCAAQPSSIPQPTRPVQTFLTSPGSQILMLLNFTEQVLFRRDYDSRDPDPWLPTCETE